MGEGETRQRAGGAQARLPALMTTTIGRTQEIAALVALLRQQETRLVTLTGPGGVGKTRLSLEIARVLRHEFADGLLFVSLAPLREQGQVLRVLAQAAGIEEGGGLELARHLFDYLSDKRCLLLLDNFEHLLPAGQLVAELLANSLYLKILVNSREMLHIYGEREIIVSPLALPELNEAGVMCENAAMELFVERARAVKATFALNDENRRAVAEICIQLDGLPLAIELAAARSKLLSPQALLTRLHHRLRLLTDGPRDLPPRQQTLRKTLDWSYELLNKTEQRFFRRLGVLVGAWTFEAAEAVAEEDRADPFFILTSLVDKSLVRLVEEPTGETRFMLLETIREYALDLLEQHGERVDAQARHAAFYCSLAEATEAGLRGGNQRESLQRLDREAANIWQALRWSIETREAETALRIASALRDYFPLRSSLYEERQWLEEVLPLKREPQGKRETQAESQQECFWRTRVLYAAGVMARMRSDPDQARTRFLECQELARQVGDNSMLALALGGLAQLEFYPGHYAVARELVEEGLQATDRASDAWGRGILHCIYGDIASKQGDFATAQTRYTLSLMVLRACGDLYKQAETLVNQGHMMRQRGKLKTAHYLYRKGLQLFREIGNRWGQLICLNGMGEALWMQGNYTEGRASFEEALALSVLLGERAERAAALTGLGQIALCLGEDVQAGLHLKEALRLAREVNHTRNRAEALAGLGDRERVRGDWESAFLYYTQSFELVKASDDKLLPMRLLAMLGDTARARGKLALACVQLKQSLYQAWETGQHTMLASGLEALAWLCVQANQPEHGALLLGAAHNLRESQQTPLPPAYQPAFTRDIEELRTAIGPAAFSECWSEGCALLLKQVMAIAVARISITEMPGETAKAPAITPYNLTARELDVLRLLANGHPDARIAKMLVISPRTVNTHLRSIYAKLGVSTRSAATRIAFEQKLFRASDC